MKRALNCAAAALIVAFAAASLGADAKTRTKTSIKFEGLMGRFMNMAAGGDTTSTVSVRGSRMASIEKDSGQIIDLAEERVYQLDIRRKEYRVRTFAEIRAELEKMKAQMEEAMAAQEQQEEPEPQPGMELELDVDVDETGETKRIAGQDTRQVILTITARQKDRTLEEGGGFVMTNDMWLGSEQPAVQEIGAFMMKYAQAVYGEALGIDPRQAASLSALIPALGNLTTRMMEEGQKLQGTPLMTVSTFETVKSEEQVKAAQAQQPSGGGGLGGMLARRLAGNRNVEPRTKVMTSTHELESISTSVTDADVAIPEGFTEKR
jgi:hypothetical protein